MTAVFGEPEQGGLGDLFNQVAMFSASQLEPGDDLRPGDHALHLRLDHLPAPRQRLSAAGKTAKRGRERPEENQRIHPLRHRALCWGKAGSTCDFLAGYELVNANFLRDAADHRGLHFVWQLAGVLTMTAGTVFLMWLGEQIDEYGIGNGISLLIMAGILARLPTPSTTT